MGLTSLSGIHPYLSIWLSGLRAAWSFIQGLFLYSSLDMNACARCRKAAVFAAQMIDEVHTLIGAGAAEGAIDAANILKPALARGELQCIGATTLDEYRKHIEKDPALERRFQPVKIRLRALL
jgi:hypothetical protein